MLEGEKQIIRLISQGDESAFRDLFDYYYPKVLTFLEYYISNEEDTRDLAQNIFAKLWAMRETLADIRSFGAYLFRLCRNGAIDYSRRHRIRISITDNYEESLSSTLDEEYLAKESRLRYQRCLDGMPERRREVFSLSREEGLSNDEISRKLRISKKTVENHINAALKELRKTVS
ncbi:MAG: RNA polymerase sigma-70 factor [Bacteroidales bacterium]|nr:RNA polymerase sigma-70 factor [Bacteroidales bacterium]